MTEEKLIDLYFARDEKALTETQADYGNLCMLISQNILGNEEDAEECVNDTLLAVWNNIPPARPNPFKSYICKIVRNLSLKRFHHNSAAKRNSLYDGCLDEMEDFLTDGQTPETAYELKELTQLIEEFLDSLARENRIIFMRRYWFADTYDTIADITGLTVKNVSVRLTRLRKELKDFLEEREVSV